MSQIRQGIAARVTRPSRALPDTQCVVSDSAALNVGFDTNIHAAQ
jgi:hypothetical protein